MQLQHADTGTAINIDDRLLVYVQDDTLGSKVHYRRQEDFYMRQITVKETPAEIRAISQDDPSTRRLALFSFTDKDQGRVHLNADRVSYIDSRNNNAYIEYDAGGAEPKYFEARKKEKGVKRDMYEAMGFTVYEFDDANATNSTFDILDSAGDVTSDFPVNKAFQVFGSGGGNDTIFTVSSSSFGGGDTTVTVNETIPDGSKDKGLIVLRS